MADIPSAWQAGSLPYILLFMKKITLIIIVIACALAAVWFFVLKVPFPEKYDQAKKLFDTGQVQGTLPVFAKAVEIFKNQPEYPEAVYYLAKCETFKNKNHRANWQALLGITTDQNKIIEAEYQLARTSSDKAAAAKQFVKKYPETKEAKNFMIALSSKSLEQKDLKLAKEFLQKLADYHKKDSETINLIDKLGEINLENLCSRTPLPFITNHIVKSGEYLSSIAKKNKTSVDSIKKINNLSRDTIKKGARLRIDKSDYLIKVDISDNILTLFRVFDGKTNFVKYYQVGTGREDNTPRGTFKVNLKQKKPTWYKPGGTPIPFGSKENELGTRWMGIDCAGFGIHGTWKPESVGKPSSAGCVRMLNKDVEELYDITPFGVPVIIED